MTDSGKTMVSIRLPNELLEQIDARAERLGINRTKWFENMTRWVLTHTELIQRRGEKP